MLRKSFVFMMLLAASLIGIGSAANHQPEVAVTQPQPQQPLQSPQQGQIQSPNTAASPTLGKRLTSPQGMQQQQKSSAPTAVQIVQDKELVNRLFPYIIQKIDGKTLAQKIDAATLVQRIDAKTLANKVLPFLDANVILTERAGEATTVKVSRTLGIKGTGSGTARATCAADEIAVSGGVAHDFRDPPYVVDFRRLPNLNSWEVYSWFTNDGRVAAIAECLKIELSLREEARQPPPPPPPPPSQPPGGPPLQPPPGFGK